MERLKIGLTILRNKEIVNTFFTNEKTNLIKLLSYMSGYTLNKSLKNKYKIQVKRNFQENQVEYSDIVIKFENDLEYLFTNVPTDSLYYIEESKIIEILGIEL